MNGQITLFNNDYTVIINLRLFRATIDIAMLLDETSTNRINWNAFNVNDDLWYNDGTERIICIGHDREDKIIRFE